MSIEQQGGLSGTLARWKPKTVLGRALLVASPIPVILIVAALSGKKPAPVHAETPMALQPTTVAAAASPAAPATGCRIEWGKKICDGSPAPAPSSPSLPVVARVAPEPLPEPSRAQPSLPAPGTCRATYAQFKRLRVGMHLQTAQDILGCEGTLESEMRLGTDQYRTYGWRGNTFFSAVTIMMERNRIDTLSQFGLE